MFVLPSKGSLVCAAFSPRTSVLVIAKAIFHFIFLEVFCYQLYPPLLWSANLRLQTSFLTVIGAFPSVYSFFTYHSEHSYFNCFESVVILNFHSLASAP